MIVMYYKSSIWNVENKALTSVNELLGKYNLLVLLLGLS